MNMNNDLNFDCNKCGKCCKATPQLMDKEILEYSDKFFIQLSHYSILSYEKNPLDKELLDHYSKFCHIFFIPEKECHLYYFVSLTAVARPSEFCPQLGDDNLCNIEKKDKNKPMFCKVAPLNIMMPESQQKKIFELQWKPLIDKKIFQCSVGEEASKLIVNGDINDYDNQENYYTLLTNIKSLTDFYIKKYLKDEEKIKEHIKYCLDLCVKGNSNVFYSSSLDLLNFYCNLSLITKYELNIFIENQINYIQKDIEKALIKKDLNDRSITNLLRKELEKFTKYKIEDKNEENEEVIIM